MGARKRHGTPYFGVVLPRAHPKFRGIWNIVLTGNITEAGVEQVKFYELVDGLPMVEILRQGFVEIQGVSTRSHQRGRGVPRREARGDWK